MEEEYPFLTPERAIEIDPISFAPIPERPQPLVAEGDLLIRQLSAPTDPVALYMPESIPSKKSLLGTPYDTIKNIKNFSENKIDPIYPHIIQSKDIPPNKINNINTDIAHIYQAVKSLKSKSAESYPTLLQPYQKIGSTGTNKISPSLSRISSSTGMNYAYPVIGSTKPEDLPAMALPVLEFVEQVQPHIVIGCDRGGRLFSLAMHAAWRETRGGEPFPTLDGKIHFARISKSENPAVLQEKVDAIVALSKRFGEHKGNTVDDSEQLRVLFVDDWVIGGGTKRLAEMLLEKHGAKSFFAVMTGGQADVSGEPDRMTTNVAWHDRPEEIGVNYLSAVHELPDGSFEQYQEVVPVRDAKATANRKKIQQAAIDLARVSEPTVDDFSFN